MAEHRQHPRRRTLKAGQIIFNHKTSVISCTVRNLSDGGACLELASSVGIPESFDLMVVADGLSRSCDVAWRSEHRIGVAFR